MTDLHPSLDPTLHPQEGARFLFELEQDGGDHAAYRAAIFTPTERFDYRARLTLEGESHVEATGTAAAAELEKKLDTLARLLARGAKKKIADELPAWPHRVLRWKGPGR
jgi:hypothetical protein